MKLGICCNFTHPSVGGSEIVCKSIAESMANTYGMQVFSFGHNVQKDFVYNNVYYKKCLRGKYFIEQIKELDHLFVYSDSFWGFETILNDIDRIYPSLSIALLGMYAMHDNPLMLDVFKDNKQRFKAITHSKDSQDYKKCFKSGIPVTVVPNGVNINEFEASTDSHFRDKYNIKTKYMILNVSNYFYGKGQEYIIDIGNALKGLREDDFTIVQLSNSVKYPHDVPFFEKVKNLYSKRGNFQCKFLRDIPRNDIASAFNDADVSILTSLKEVAPIVILESMGSRTPWISMDVGNVDKLWGGMVIANNEYDNKGYKIFTDVMTNAFASKINGVLNRPYLSQQLSEQGMLQVETIYNWDSICEQYYNIFIS